MRQLTTADAVATAQYFHDKLGKKLWLIAVFGSVANVGYGNDLDLMLFVNTAIADQFRADFQKEIKGISPEKKAKETIRRKVARKCLKLDCLTPDTVPENSIDIILAPNLGRFELTIEECLRLMHSDPAVYSGDDTMDPRKILIFSTITSSFVTYDEWQTQIAA